MKGETILNDLIKRYPALEPCKNDIWEACSSVIGCYLNNGQLLVCGNGGSCADSGHIVGELMKSFAKKRPLDKGLAASLKSIPGERGAYIAGKLEGGLPAISLNAHTSLFSAISNDIGADLVFAQQVAGYGREGDVLIAISSSGDSQNVVDAAITAKAKGLKVIGLTGQTGGVMKQYCDIAICAPSMSTPGIQEYHLPVYHTICRIVEDNMFN
ncbi:Phosphoheptose isomerase [hydrothermal vent metagenome]|uniref:Phosphoheptose isomerase n=1 Tax=hydrothermal vent metagenome TaxID=652676 RepID=A0A3B0U325_9ZZZZ